MFKAGDKLRITKVTDDRGSWKVGDTGVYMDIDKITPDREHPNKSCLIICPVWYEFEKIEGRVMEFKKGDRVQGCCKHLVQYLKPGTIEDVIKDPLDDKCYRVKWDNGDHLLSNWYDNELEKLGGSMSKYDELKSRINNLNNGWDRDADEIIREVAGSSPGRERCSISMTINNYHSDAGGATIKAYKDDADEYGDGEMFGYFKWSSRCEKMKAFREALIWLLDHSAIKDNLTGQTVKADIDGKVYKVKVIAEVE